jgi:Rrf2 family nitric oxide-sensitive transcriptional repressor
MRFNTMRLTRFTIYSLRVLIYLAQNTQNRVTINQISEAYDISKNHLMKVVSNLTRVKLVVAQRGPGGGIQLNRLPEDIGLDDVIRNTEKHFQQPEASATPEPSTQTADDRLNNYLQYALEVYLQTLGRFTLADVIDPKTNASQFLDTDEKAA